MIKVNNDLVLKVVNAMKYHNATEYSLKTNTHILDLEKGFLFYNNAKGWLYKGLSKVQSPGYLSGEVKRLSTVFNYTIGVKDSIFKVHKDRTEDDFKKLLNEIVE